MPSAEDPMTEPTRTASIGRALPLTMNGSSASHSKRVGDRSTTSVEAMISPCAARAMSRAARFTVSPITV